METKMRLIWTDYKFKRGFSFLERERERERERVSTYKFRF